MKKYRIVNRKKKKSDKASLKSDITMVATVAGTLIAFLSWLGVKP